METILELIRQNEHSIHIWMQEAPAAVALIAILYFILKRNLFDPIENILEKRAAVLSGAAKSEEEALVRHADSARRCEEALRSAHAEAARVRDAERARAQTAADAVLAGARAEGDKALREALVQLELDIERGRTVLERESHDLAQMLVTRLVEGKGAGA